MKRSELIFGALLVPVDFFMFLMAGIAAYFLRVSPLIAQWRPVLFALNLPFQRYFILLILVSVLGIIIFAISGLYSIGPQKKLFKEFFRIVVAISATLLAIIIYIFFSRELFESRFIILVAWGFAIIFVSLGRFFIKKIQRYVVAKYDIGVHYVVIIGKDKMTKKVIKEIKNHPDLGYRIVKNFLELEIEKIKKFLKRSEIDEVILASPRYERNEVLEILDFCEEQRIGFKFVPNLFQALTTNIELDTFDSAPLIEIKRTPLDGWGKIIKRAVDILGSFIGLALLSPLFLIIILVIKTSSKGPAFVKLKRISQRREFYLYKFRSMVKDAERFKKDLLDYNERIDGPLFKMKKDPRITKVGGFLRKTRLDELPQFLNVLKGEMSLVGPRPHQPDEIAKYEKHHKKVLLIRPGITGMAQISGSSDLPFEEEVKLDSYYIENWSLKRDIHILLKTFIILFTDRSAC